jgi:hypothetical protein
MVEPLRHRQTKEAATDMFSLQPPRHISTLPNPEELKASKCRPLFLDSGRARTAPGYTEDRMSVRRWGSAWTIDGAGTHRALRVALLSG